MPGTISEIQVARNGGLHYIKQYPWDSNPPPADYKSGMLTIFHCLSLVAVSCSDVPPKGRQWFIVPQHSSLFYVTKVGADR
jgi:hypothetical protein